MKNLILCPECGSVELATIDTSTVPWWTYIHDCENCGYTIMESEWDSLPALSVRQPWAYLICAGLKDIENRTWKLPEKYKGQRVLIHAGAKPWTFKALVNYLTPPMISVLETVGFNAEWALNLQTSAIIGSVEIVDCVQNHPSIWAEHKAYKKVKKNGVESIIEVPVYNWVLKNPVLFDEPVLNVKGQLSFFKPKID